jgi:hypothetical protein
LRAEAPPRRSSLIPQGGQGAPGTKVFQEGKKDSSFSEEKEAKRLLCLRGPCDGSLIRTMRSWINIPVKPQEIRSLFASFS